MLPAKQQDNYEDICEDNCEDNWRFLWRYLLRYLWTDTRQIHSSRQVFLSIGIQTTTRLYNECIKWVYLCQWVDFMSILLHL